MIVFSNVQKQFGSKVLYNGFSAALNPTQRIGLIGPNGAGKTMLVRIILGQESPDSGTVSIPSNLRFAYLPQELAIDEDVTPIDYILRPFASLLDAHKHLENATDSTMEQALAHYEKMQAELAVHGGYGIEARAKSFLAGLGVPQDSWDKDIRRLSGGYRMRVVLAQMLLVSPDFLMMDEPTNHLDMDSLIWLEKFLQRFPGGMLVISHDRDFLNRITNATAELEGGKLTVFSGNVDKFLAWKEQIEQTDEKRRKNIQAQIDQAEDFVRRFKAKATKASQAHSREKLAERLRKDLPEEVQRYTPTMKLTIPPPPKSGTLPLKINDISVGYDGAPVFSSLSLTVHAGDKIAIIGPNGAGKSTLLKTCAGLITPRTGQVELHSNTIIRYYSQHRLEQLDPRLTLYQTIQSIVGDNRNTIQSVLGAFLFSGDDALKSVGVLSGGEKSRLSLAAILADPGNLLMLDEPTNHLDIQTVERLADALADYEGTVILVSHEERFVSRVANRIFEMRPGVVRDFPGTLEDYRSYIEAGYLESLGEASKAESPGTLSADTDKQDRIRRREERKKIERRKDKVEASIKEVETKMEEVSSILHDPAHATDYGKLQEATQEQTRLEEQYDALLLAWDELETKLREEG